MTTAPPTPETITKTLTLLSHPSDTNRFVGLALLSSLLTHTTDHPTILLLWRALPPKFLDRLLRSSSSSSSSKPKDPEQAQAMVDLAVSVLVAFATVLSPEEYDDAFVGRAPALICALESAPPVTRGAAVKVLLAIASVVGGAEVVLGTGKEGLGRLLGAAEEQEGALQVVVFALVNSGYGRAREAMEVWFPVLCGEIKGMMGEKLEKVLKFLAEVLTRVPSELLPDDTAWVSSLYATITALLATRHKSTVRHSSIIIVAALLHRYPPALLFNAPSTATESRSPLYHFLQLTLITLRASFPSLLESLRTPSYSSLSHTLAAAFDITAAFLGHLVTSDGDDDDDSNNTFDSTTLTPDELLKLRTDLSETFSLTLEFLRDRWDATFAGAEGFEPGHEAPGVPLSLTWDSALPGGLLKDPIIMAATRALALWVREEESQRAEAGGLMDFWLGLWTRGAEQGVDYRVWVITALEGVLEEAHGRAQFGKYNGWHTIFSDLKRIYRGPTNDEEDEDDIRLAISEAQLLAGMVAAVEEASEEMVKDSVGLTGINGNSGLRLELDAEVLRLASTCLVHAHRGMRKRMQDEVTKAKQVARRLVLDMYENGRTDSDEGVMALVEEVAEQIAGM